jgi:hypothetical protein
VRSGPTLQPSLIGVRGLAIGDRQGVPKVVKQRLGGIVPRHRRNSSLAPGPPPPYRPTSWLALIPLRFAGKPFLDSSLDFWHWVGRFGLGFSALGCRRAARGNGAAVASVHATSLWLGGRKTQRLPLIRTGRLRLDIGSRL